jgi:hypothetical protein
MFPMHKVPVSWTDAAWGAFPCHTSGSNIGEKVISACSTSRYFVWASSWVPTYFRLLGSLMPLDSPHGLSCLGCLRHFVYSKFRIFRMFFCFVYHSKMAQILRNYTKFLYANLYNSAVFWEILWLVIPIFLTIQHRRHFLHTAEKLQDADWGWGRYDNTPLNPYPFTRVFTTFRILEISYISNVFLVSYTIRKYTFRIRIQISISFVFIQF